MAPMPIQWLQRVPSPENPPTRRTGRSVSVPWHRATVGSYRGGGSYERGTPTRETRRRVQGWQSRAYTPPRAGLRRALGVGPLPATPRRSIAYPALHATYFSSSLLLSSLELSATTIYEP